MNRRQLVGRIEAAWAAFNESFVDLPEARMTEPGVVGDWSVKDLLAHVTTWEEEALKYLPMIASGGRPPRYASVGGLDAFNARRTAEKRTMTIAAVRREADEVHLRLIEMINGAPEEMIKTETRFRRRVRLDTYGHYPEHAEAIRKWRSQGAGR